MPIPKAKHSAIGVTAFKSKCLGLIDEVAQGKTDSIVLLKHNRPVAKIVPANDEAGKVSDLWGALQGTFTIAPGVDLAESTDEVWDAEQ